MKRKELPAPILAMDPDPRMTPEQAESWLEVVRSRVDEQFAYWRKQDCEGCDSHTSNCGELDWCCASCPIRLREVDARINGAREHTTASLDFNAEPPTVTFSNAIRVMGPDGQRRTYHPSDLVKTTNRRRVEARDLRAGDVLAACDHASCPDERCARLTAHGDEWVNLPPAQGGESALVSYPRRFTREQRVALESGISARYQKWLLIPADIPRICVRLVDLSKPFDYVPPEPCPTSNTARYGLLIIAAVWLVIILLIFTSCARRETPAQAKQEEEPTWPANTPTTSSESATPDLQPAPTSSSSPSGATTAAQAASGTPTRVPLPRSATAGALRSSAVSPLRSPATSATDTAQPLRPAEVRQVSSAAASVVPPAQVRRRAVRSGSPPRVVIVPDHPDMVLDQFERYRRPAYMFIAVQYAAEAIEDGSVLQVDYLKCACMSHGFLPTAPHVRGSWLVFPIDAQDDRREGDRYFELRYPDDAKNLIVPQVRVKDLPVMAFADLR